MSLDRINAALFDQPHLYHPGKAETFVRVFGPRLTGTNVTIVNGDGGVDHTAFAGGRPSAGVLGDRLGRAYDRHSVRPFDMIDGVAVIPIEGTLVQKGSWIGQSSGETSYQGLQTQIARAGRDEVKGAVFEVDSFGGMVNGAFETATSIRQLSARKPTIAILTDFAYSAAYLLASQCRQIIVPEFGGAGSIGVVTLHADWSEALENEGIRVTIIHAGKHKVDGNPYEPLPEAVRAEWQARVEAIRERFAEVVGQGRGKRYSKADALKSEAKSYEASEAARLGLVDAVGDPQEAFETFITEVNRRP
jgi:signal peptide peptidase SppA|tara:strand:- start:49358 stop:50272 length:915 start_codon:yes stop_codon:yes gene_type:complete